MKTDLGVQNWRKISRKGVFEVLHVLEKNGRERFSDISQEVEELCLATLASALTIADDLGLIEKTSYIITNEGTLRELMEDELKEGARPQATFYKIEDKGKAVLELKERLGDVLGSAKPRD